MRAVIGFVDDPEHIAGHPIDLDPDELAAFPGWVPFRRLDNTGTVPAHQANLVELVPAHRVHSIVFTAAELERHRSDVMAFLGRTIHGMTHPE